MENKLDVLKLHENTDYICKTCMYYSPGDEHPARGGCIRRLPFVGTFQLNVCGNHSQLVVDTQKKIMMDASKAMMELHKEQADERDQKFKEDMDKAAELFKENFPNPSAFVDSEPNLYDMPFGPINKLGLPRCVHCTKKYVKGKRIASIGVPWLPSCDCKPPQWTRDEIQEH